MGIDQLTFEKSCRQLGRRGILSLCVNYNLYNNSIHIENAFQLHGAKMTRHIFKHQGLTSAD